MKLVSKAAAFGAAAALTATGLVAAASTSADAATVTKSVTYNCNLAQFAPLFPALGLPSNTPATQPIKAAYSVPALPSKLTAGQAVPVQTITAAVTVPQVVSAIVAFVSPDTNNPGKGVLTGSVTGQVKFGAQGVGSKLAIPPQDVDPAKTTSTVNASGTIAAFKPSMVGANAVSLPSVVTATLNNASVTCTAVSGSNLSLGTVKVETKAQKKLAKDEKALKKAKKAYKKAHGAKKAKLHKKVVKLTKTVKKDKKAVEAGK